MRLFTSSQNILVNNIEVDSEHGLDINDYYLVSTKEKESTRY